MTLEFEPTSVLDEVLDGVAVVQVDGEAVDASPMVTAANARFHVLAGQARRPLPFALDELVGDDVAAWRERIDGVVSTGRAVTAEIRWRGAGQSLPMQARVAPVPGGVVATLAERTPQVRHRGTVQRLVHQLDVAPDIRISIDDDGVIVAASPLSVDRLGPVIGEPLVRVLHARSQRRWVDHVTGALDAHRLWSGDMVFEPVSEYQIATHVSAVRIGDRTEILARDEAQLAEWADHMSTAVGLDAETGLGNRLATLDVCEAALTRVRFGGSSLVVCAINSGDEVLQRSDAKALGSAISSAVHPGIVIGRSGPSTFVVLSEDRSSETDAGQLAKEMHRAGTTALGGPPVTVGVAVGAPTDRADHLLARADRAAALAAASGSPVFVADVS